jgi:ADP-heptose:LPS heptosyltransferase
VSPSHARRFVIVRQDNLGDVALALPMAGLLKRAVPGCHVAFAVRGYARDVVAASRYVDAALVFDGPDGLERVLREHRPDAVILALPSRGLARAAARARVPIRVGTARRWYHWLWCTHRPFVRRKGSALHEAQLDLRLLAPFVADVDLPRGALWPLAGLGPRDPSAAAPHAGTAPPARAASPSEPTAAEPTAAMDPPRPAPGWPLRPGVANLLLQMRSNGNGKEWPLERYVELVGRLPPQRVNAIVNGTPAEGDALRAAAPELFALPQVTDATRGFPIAALMAALPRMDAVLSNSTGPMHLAALSGAPTVGLFVDLPGMDAARWGPLGPNARAVLAPRAACVRCPRGAARCPCMAAIDVDTVLRALPPRVAGRDAG